MNEQTKFLMIGLVIGAVMVATPQFFSANDLGDLSEVKDVAVGSGGVTLAALLAWLFKK